MNAAARAGGDGVADGQSLVRRVLVDLVQTPSVNPGIYELAIAERIVAWLEPTSAEVELVEMAPGRPSVAAVLRGDGSGPRLVLNGHMDTVPVDDEGRWSTGPFAAEIRDGYMYGRGSCDMKAGLAVQIATAHALAAGERRLKGDLILHFAAGEECGEPGTLSLCQAGYVGDFGIVTEPTELQISVATRGLAMIQVRIHGRSIHASRAAEGVNPVTRLPAVLGALAAYGRQIAERSHPLLGSGSCTPTVVQGGVKTNAVADFCDLYVDRRLVPGESVAEELETVRAFLEPLRAEDPEFEYELSCAPYPFEPAEVSPESELAARVQRIAGEELGVGPAIIGTPYSSDVRNLINDAGMEAITFGPGNAAECHCVDERVSLRQLEDAAAVTTAVAMELLCDE